MPTSSWVALAGRGRVSRPCDQRRRGGRARLPRRCRCGSPRSPRRRGLWTWAAARPSSSSGPDGGPTWWRSIDLGCVRLTERFLADDPPGKVGHGRGSRRSRATRSRARPRRCRWPRSQPEAPPARFASSWARRSGLTSSLRRAESRSARRGGSQASTGRSLTRADARPGAVVLAAVQRRLSVPFVVARGACAKAWRWSCSPRRVPPRARRRSGPRGLAGLREARPRRSVGAAGF